MNLGVYICKSYGSQNTVDALYIVAVALGNGILLLRQR